MTTPPHSLRLNVEHEESDRCAGYHCLSCGVDEDGPHYRACFECGHLYRSQRELRRAYRRVIKDHHGDDHRSLVEGWHHWRARWLTRASQIHFCQECSHDFLPQAV